MLVSVTIKCDWTSCGATLTYEPRLLTPEPHHGWKTEMESAYSLHLCPKHKHHAWHKVRDQLPRLAPGSTGHFMM